MTQEQVIASILGSPEYLTRSPLIIGVNTNPDASTFVRAAYLQLFPNYVVSQGEINFFVIEINSGQLTDKQVAFILDTSSLYRFGGSGAAYVNGFVSRTYLQFLRRNATVAENTSWMNLYAANPNIRVEDLIASLLVSQEYFAPPPPAPLHKFP